MVKTRFDQPLQFLRQAASKWCIDLTYFSLAPLHPPLTAFVMEWHNYYFWLYVAVLPSLSFSWYQILPLW